MTSIWTNITTEDDPRSGMQAISVMRTFRDNDDAVAEYNGVTSQAKFASAALPGAPHTILLNGNAPSGQKVIPVPSTTGIEVGATYRIEQTVGGPAFINELFVVASIVPGVSITAVANLTNSYNSGFANVYARTATGCILRFFLPPHSKTGWFYWYMGGTSVPSNRFWGVVRFNGNPALETPLTDSYYASFPVLVSGLDLSSLASGVYEAEVYAGSDNAAKSNIINLPAGRSIADSTPSTNFDSSARSSMVFGTEDWTESPASAVTDAQLTADKGFIYPIAQAFYDRDEKMRRKPAGYLVAEKTAAVVHPAFVNYDLPLIYVPRSADVLALDVEIKTDSGGTARAILSCVELEADGYGFFDESVSEAVTSTATSYEKKTLRVNLSPRRGREATLRLWINNDVTAKTSYFRVLETGGHRWEVSPIPPFDIYTPEDIAAPWRSWPAVARQQGALLHAAWFRRMAQRDLDLMERQMLQRGFSYTIPGTASVPTLVTDSQMRLWQPMGIGAAGGKLVAYIELAGTAAAQINFGIDYSDIPQGIGGNWTGWVSATANGLYKVTRPALAARDGTEQIFGAVYLIGGNARIIRTQDAPRARMRWEL